MIFAQNVNKRASKNETGTILENDGKSVRAWKNNNNINNNNNNSSSIISSSNNNNNYSNNNDNKKRLGDNNKHRNVISSKNNNKNHLNKSKNAKGNMSNSVLFEAENPFQLPTDNEIYHLPGEGLVKDKEKQKKVLKAHEKTTYISRMNATNTKIVKDIEAAVAEEFAAQNVENPPKNWDMGVAKDRIVEKEGMEDYIGKKRELFFTRFLHRAKAAEKRRLTALAHAEKMQIHVQEKQTAEKARAFDAFLKEMDKTSIGVLREAEDQTNRKMELQLEIKRLNAQIMALLSEITKHEDTLKEYQLYKRFLDSLAPREWKEERRALHHQRKLERNLGKSAEEVREEKEEGEEDTERLEGEGVDSEGGNETVNADLGRVVGANSTNNALSSGGETSDKAATSSGLKAYVNPASTGADSTDNAASSGLNSSNNAGTNNNSSNGNIAAMNATKNATPLVTDMEGADAALFGVDAKLYGADETQFGADGTTLFGTGMSKTGNLNYALIDVDEGGISSESDSEKEEEEEEQLDLFFTDPNQLLDILGDLEEQNLSLIQNSQETEETLDDIKSNIKIKKQTMQEETEELKRQIDILEIAIQKEQERARVLERKYATISGGGGEESEETEADRAERAVEKRVTEIYQMCIGDEESNISTVQMLTNIEICMEELLCFMERTPKDKLDAAEKVKEQERKEKLKREALALGKKMAEERRKRELERANADVKPKKGKQLVFRSDPPPPKAKAASQRMKQMIQQEEEQYYFFKW